MRLPKSSRFALGLLAAVIPALPARIQAATLEDVCTESHVKSTLPSDDTIQGISIDSRSVKVDAVKNFNSSASEMFPAAIFDYCNVTFSYTHAGTNDKTTVWYWLPAPDDFKRRYLSTGGGGYAITSGAGSLPGGVMYGTVSGTTDGGFGSFETNYDSIALIHNGTLNYPHLFAFGYKAIHELTLLGQQFSKNFFDTDTIYSYYQGCSEGGREGFSQIQRFGSVFDGVVIGAPAIRYGFQQANHLFQNLVEKTLDYFPSPCEFEKINNDTISACDELDGKQDGVVSRLSYNVSSSIGSSYSCPATSASTVNLRKRQMQQSAAPATNGTVTKEACDIAQIILDGLKDTSGKQAYLSYQPGASFDDESTTYNEETGRYELSISSFGAEWVDIFLKEINSTTFDFLDDVTYDTLRDWMYEGFQKYQDSLQTTWPDLSAFKNNGGKILHWHGEQDPSIPTASSIRYLESVRKVMYPTLSLNESYAEMNDWYRFYVIQGAGHCGPSAENGPFPQTNLNVLIDWVERDKVPTTLNATVLQGKDEGQSRQICTWPLRPQYDQEKDEDDCVFDQASFDSWIYNLDSFPISIY